MTHKILRGPELLADLRSALSKGKSAKLAIAFWGKGAMKALEGIDLTKLEIICNLKMGGTNPEVIEQLKEKGAKVLAHPTLHAKMGIVDDAWGFLGSSNFSANGLSLQGKELDGWEELNASFSDKASVTDLANAFHRYEAAARNIAKADLDEAQRQWDLRRHAAIQRPREPENLIKVLRERPDALNDLRIFLVRCKYLDGTEQQEMDALEEKLKQMDPDRVIADYYLDFPELPKSGFYLNFQFDSSGELALEDVFERSPYAIEQRVGKDTVQQVAAHKNIPGFEVLTLSEKRELAEAYLGYLRKEKIDTEAHSGFEEIEVIAPYLSKPKRA